MRLASSYSFESEVSVWDERSEKSWSLPSERSAEEAWKWEDLWWPSTFIQAMCDELRVLLLVNTAKVVHPESLPCSGDRV